MEGDLPGSGVSACISASIAITTPAACTSTPFGSMTHISSGCKAPGPHGLLEDSAAQQSLSFSSAQRQHGIMRILVLIHPPGAFLSASFFYSEKDASMPKSAESPAQIASTETTPDQESSAPTISLEEADFPETLGQATIAATLAIELKIKPTQVLHTLELLDDGNTVP